MPNRQRPMRFIFCIKTASLRERNRIDHQVSGPVFTQVPPPDGQRLIPVVDKAASTLECNNGPRNFSAFQQTEGGIDIAQAKAVCHHGIQIKPTLFVKIEVS